MGAAAVGGLYPGEVGTMDVRVVYAAARRETRQPDLPRGFVPRFGLGNYGASQNQKLQYYYNTYCEPASYGSSSAPYAPPIIAIIWLASRLSRARGGKEQAGQELTTGKHPTRRIFYEAWQS